MRLDLAYNVKVGDVLYNCFMDELVITSIYQDIANNSIIFGTVDTRLYKSSYDSNDLYLKNLDGECDEEKSWIEWSKNNREYFDTFDDVSSYKKIYMIGFGNGFQYKREVSFEEMMQK